MIWSFHIQNISWNKRERLWNLKLQRHEIELNKLEKYLSTTAILSKKKPFKNIWNLNQPILDAFLWTLLFVYVTKRSQPKVDIRLKHSKLCLTSRIKRWGITKTTTANWVFPVIQFSVSPSVYPKVYPKFLKHIQQIWQWAYIELENIHEILPCLYKYRQNKRDLVKKYNLSKHIWPLAFLKKYLFSNRQTWDTFINQLSLSVNVQDLTEKTYILSWKNSFRGTTKQIETEAPKEGIICKKTRSAN